MDIFQTTTLKTKKQLKTKNWTKHIKIRMGDWWNKIGIARLVKQEMNNKHRTNKKVTNQPPRPLRIIIKIKVNQD